MEQGTRGVKRPRTSGRTVTISVGANAEPLTIHENILQERSGSFADALNKCRQEGASGKIELPDDDHELVGAYFDWLYSNIISSKQDEETAQLTVDEIIAEFIFLARMYALGEKLADNDFCNAILCATLKKCDESDPEGLIHFPGTKTVKIIYDGTPEGAPVRKFLVDAHARFGHPAWIEEDGEKEHPEFLRDLAKSLMELRTPQHFKLKPEYRKRELWFRKP